MSLFDACQKMGIEEKMNTYSHIISTDYVTDGL